MVQLLGLLTIFIIRLKQGARWSDQRQYFSPDPLHNDVVANYPPKSKEHNESYAMMMRADAKVVTIET